MTKKDLMNEEEIKQKAEKAIDMFAKRIGINLPRNNYPSILVVQPTYDRPHSYYDPFSMSIGICTSDRLGEALGEELGHFFRDILRKKVLTDKRLEEPITTEFFGLLGRRILYASLSEEERRKMFPEGVQYNSEHERKQILLNSRFTRKRERNLVKKIEERAIGMTKYGIKEEEIQAYRSRAEKIGRTSIQEGYAKRRNDLIHHQGYTYAFKLDLEKIKKLKSLFEMPNQEVRRNFFRSDQRYDAFDDNEKSYQERGLAKKISASTIIIIIGSLLFSFSSLTGNVIADLSTYLSNLIGIVLFIIGLIGTWIYSFIIPRSLLRG